MSKEIIEQLASNNNLLDAFIEKSDEKTLYDLYKLMMHYGINVEYFIKQLFKIDFSSSEIYFFREGKPKYMIIADFISYTGGDFSNMVNQIIKLATESKMKKISDAKKKKLNRSESPRKKNSIGSDIFNIIESPRNKSKKERNIIMKAIDIIRNELSKSVSDILIDFCCDMCFLLNEFFEHDKQPDYGQKIICSFIFFSIIVPKIIKCSNLNELSNVLPLVKILNSIAISDVECEYVDLYVDIRAIVSDIFMKRKPTKYVKENKLEDLVLRECTHSVINIIKANQDCFYQICELDRILSDDSTTDTNIIIIGADDDTIKPISKKISLTKLVKKTSYGRITASLLSNSINNLDITPRSNSLEHFLLWSTQQVSEYLMERNIETDFIIKWDIDGDKFLSLKKDIMIEMGIFDIEYIKKIMAQQSIILDYAITSTVNINKHIILWSCDDLCTWLTICGMKYLVEIFRKNKISSGILLKLDINDFYEMGIKHPKDIDILNQLRYLM